MGKVIRQTLTSFLIAMVLMAMFNSASLLTWAYDLQACALSDRISFYAENWDEAMQDLGPARVTDSLRNWFQEAAGV